MKQNRAESNPRLIHERADTQGSLSPSKMSPLSLTVAKNKRTGFRLRVRKKIATLRTICDDPEVLELDKLSTALDRLMEAWRMYENSNLEVLGIVLEDEVEDEQATFSEMEENYNAAINKAKKIIKGEFGADDEDRDSQYS